MSAAPRQSRSDLLALWIHNDNLALFQDVRCLSCPRHFVLRLWLPLRDSRRSLVDWNAHKPCDIFRCFFFLGGLEPKKSTYVKSKTRTTTSQQKEQTRLQLANCKARWNRFIWHILGETWAPKRWLSTSVLITFMVIIFSAAQLLRVWTVREVTENVFRLSSLKVTPLNGGTFMIGH